MKTNPVAHIPRTLPLMSSFCVVSLIAFFPARGQDQKDETNSAAQTSEDSQTSNRIRPPGGDGSMFFRVFVSRNDKNGDGIVEKSEFRGSGDRFDQMDKNGNGRLDRPEIDELHRSRVADPLSMRQRIAEGKTRRPPVDPSVIRTHGTNELDQPHPESAEPTAITPRGTRITSKQAFARLDTDGNEMVSPIEFQRSPGMSDPKNAKEAVARIDQNGDGNLSFPEFNEVFAKRHGPKPIR